MDQAGAITTSKNGMGGLMLVSHLKGEAIYAFDLNRTDGSVDLVGKYKTASFRNAGLEFDRSTGLLFIWHGDGFDKLELARLSSSVVNRARQLDAVRIYSGPGAIFFNYGNHEGIAVMSNDSCVDAHRGLFMTTDGASFWSLLLYRSFLCEDPFFIIP